MKQDTFSDISFDQIDLCDPLKQALANAGFERLTRIQAAALPVALEGKDVAGQSQTGTGKTLAFLLAAMHRLLTTERSENGESHDPRVLILAPTRELARQIHKDAVLLNEKAGLRLALAYGGVDYQKQRDALARGSDMLIGTPGRIIDYFKQGVFSLKALDVLILDEADRMFDMGFIKDIRYLLNRAPAPTERLSMLFSATLNLRVAELAFEHMNDPVQIDASEDRITADQLQQWVYYPSADEKMPLLLGLLEEKQPVRAIIFANTKWVVHKVDATLRANGWKSGAISGDIPQNKRQRILAEFGDSTVQILVATDVAARGLHIPEVSHVFNYDLPQDSEDYVHRIGRTARMNASGEAVSFACEDSAISLPGIEEFIGHSLDFLPITDEMLGEYTKPKSAPRKRQGGSNRHHNKGRNHRRA